MPITKGDKGVIIHRQLVDPLKQLHEGDPKVKDLSFNRFVNQVLKDYVEKRRFIADQFPHLSVTAIDQEAIIIKDSKESMYVDVYLQDKQLFCLYDNSLDCEHIHYALSLPEVARLDIRAPPKPRPKTK